MQCVGQAQTAACHYWPPAVRRTLSILFSADSIVCIANIANRDSKPPLSTGGINLELSCCYMWHLCALFSCAIEWCGLASKISKSSLNFADWAVWHKGVHCVKHQTTIFVWINSSKNILEIARWHKKYKIADSLIIGIKTGVCFVANLKTCANITVKLLKNQLRWKRLRDYKYNGQLISK